MLRTFLTAAALGASALPAFAGGLSCQGDCYRVGWAPPTYGAVAERVMVRAPRTYAIVTPAEYRRVNETVMVEPGSRRWSVTRDAYGRAIGCWITTPARYATVSRTVMVRGASIEPWAVPTQYDVATTVFETSPAHKAWVPLAE